MLFLSLSLFLSAFVLSNAIRKYYSPEKVCKRLNSEIASAIQDLESEIQKTASHEFSDTKSFTDFLDKTYETTFSEKGIEILIYKKDSLKFWTANNFAAPLIRDKGTFISDVIRSGNGYYLEIGRAHV